MITVISEHCCVTYKRAALVYNNYKTMVPPVPSAALSRIISITVYYYCVCIVVLIITLEVADTVLYNIIMTVFANAPTNTRFPAC